MTVRILVADKLEPGLLDELEGVEVHHHPELSAEILPAALDGVKVLVVRSTKVTAAALQAARALALVIRAGSGVNTIDVEEASRLGIYVANCPGRNAVAVAELTFGLMLALDRSIVANAVDLHAGRWNKAEYSKSPGLKGRRLGLLGFGSIAKEVAQRAHGFEMEVMAFDPLLDDEAAKAHNVTKAVDLEDVFDHCDVVSLHLPATPKTKGMVNDHLLQRMKPGAYLINTSRAEVVDSQAVLIEVNAGRIRYAADVYADEPASKKGDFEDALGRHPNVVGTHHIGASTNQAQNEVAKAAGEIVRDYVARGKVPAAVNLLESPPVKGTLVVRHADRVGVLANVLDALRRAEINVETMENLVFAGGKAACARINISARPKPELVAALQQQEHIIAVELI